MVVAVIDTDAADAGPLLSEAAPDADVRPLDAATPAEVAVAIDDAIDERASVVAVTDGDALAEDIVQRSVRAAGDAGVLVVATGPGPEVDLPDDLAVVLVGAGGVSAGDVDARTGTAYVAGTVALVAGQVTPGEIGELLENTAEGDDHVVNAEAVVGIASNLAAGGSAIPPPEDLTGGIPPALVGIIAFGAAALAVGGTIFFAGRKPRSS